MVFPVTVMLMLPSAASADDIEATDSNDCPAFSTSEERCGEQLPVYYLTEMDIPEEYQGFEFRTDNYRFENAVIDDGWVIASDAYITGGVVDGNVYIPTRSDATIMFPDVGVWTDPDGVKHNITAVMTVNDVNSGAFIDYAGHPGFQGYHRSKNNDDFYKPVDHSKRFGLDVTFTFYYADTMELVGDDFRGVTGIGDLDGMDEHSDDPLLYYSESAEFIDGFDAMFIASNNTHLRSFGVNGFYATDENLANTNLTGEHAQQHIASGVFSGSSIRVRHSLADPKNGYAIVFGPPVYSAQLRYDVHAAAVEETTGKTISTWTVASTLATGDKYASTHKIIDGYVYTGHNSSSYPETGTVLKTDEDRTIIYNYRPAYKLTYDRNAAGATGTTADTVEAEGSSKVSIRANEYTLEGYKFTGWNTEPDNSGTAYQPNDTFTLTEDSTLYAQWEIIPVTLTYNGNASNVSGDMTGDGATVNWDTTITVSGSSYYREGHTFTGWNTSPDGTGEPYDPENPITLKQDTVLYAQWTINQITLTYDANHDRATGTTESTTVDWNTTGTINANGYTVNGYRFTGWNTAPDGTGDSYQPDDPTMVLRTDTTVYAKWEPVMTQLPSTGEHAVIIVLILLAAPIATVITVLTVNRRALYSL